MAPSRIDELTARYAENPRRYFAPLANEYRKAGDAERAAALCRVHLPSQPGHMSGHVVLGQALFELGDLAGAREAFGAAVALDDENLIALRQLGDIARAEGDVAGARAWYARVLEADPMQGEVAELQAALEASLTDATAAAALADAPLPAPSPTPFPGGMGFSDEELDAFISHVPLRDEAPPADSTAATPDAALAGGFDVDAMLAPAPSSGSEAATGVVEEGAALEPVGLLALTPFDEVPSGDAVAPTGAATDDRAADLPTGGLVLGELPPVAEWPTGGDAGVEAVVPADGLLAAEGDEAAALPVVDIADLAPDADSVDVMDEPSVAAPASEPVEFGEGEPIAEVVAESDAAAVELLFAESGESGESGEPGLEAPAAVDAGFDTFEAEPVTSAALPVEEAGAEDAVADMPGEEGGPESVIEVVAMTVATASAPDAADAPLPPVEAPVVEAPVRVAPSPASPVREAAVRLLASLAPWREVGPAGDGAAVTAATAEAVGGEVAGSADLTEPVDVVAEQELSDRLAADETAEFVDVAESTNVAEVAESTQVVEPLEVADAVVPVAVIDAAEVPAVEAAAPEEANAPVVDTAAEFGTTTRTVEPAPAEPVAGEGDEAVRTVARPTPAGFTTATMAELYRRQGFLAEALAVYRELADREPTDPWYAAQVASLEAEIAAVDAEDRHEVDAGNPIEHNVFDDAVADVVEGAVGVASLTPPGFGSIAAELADPGVPGPSTVEAGEADERDWFDEVPAEGAAPVAAGDDWFDDGGAGDAPITAEEEYVLFGMDEDERAARPAAPTPVSLDALGQGLDELFGVPMVAAADQTAAGWLEALGTEMVGRVTPGPLDLPVPAALDVPAPEAAPGVPGPLLSFDRFFGATPPGVRRQETPAAGASPVAGPSAGTPLGAPSPGPAPTPFAPVPPPPEPPTLPAAPPAPAAEGEPPRPKSDFHRWLEGLS